MALLPCAEPEASPEWYSLKAPLDFLHLTSATGLACASVQVRPRAGRAPSCPTPLHLFVRFRPSILDSLSTSLFSTCSATGPALAAGNSGEPGPPSSRGANRAPRLDGRTHRAPVARPLLGARGHMSGQEGLGAHQASCQAQTPGLWDPCPHLCSPRPRAVATPAPGSLVPPAITLPHQA